ncbi:MAG TPA: methyltransferase domain-containing protein [Mucilaginibacter sp.]|nr:methyltransferase domain-containing protein [Mucilaginibacter sp.]
MIYISNAMPASNLINPEIDSFYAQTSEEHRLELGLGPLEFERNKDLIQRYLPKKKGIIIDVGGGPGVYSEWLAGMGHEVYLVDPVEKHIKQANKRSSKSKKPFKSLLGESRKLEFADNFADVVVLHGPLYHLQLEDDRIKSIAEAKRVLKPNGVVLGFAINHSASSIAGLLNGFIHMPELYAMCKEELTTGLHNAPKNLPGILPSAYYHRPAQLRAEFEEVGLVYIDTYAVEGMVWMDKNYFETRGDAKKKEAMMELLKLTENDQALLSLSPHMMVVGKKNL